MVHSEVDLFIEKAKKWQKELKLLRSIALEAGLTEEYKWKQPCYTYSGKNIAIVSAFKNYAFISFLKGSLLSDPKGLLHKPGENSQSARLIHFQHADEIDRLRKTVKEYLFEAIEIEKKGLKVETKDVTDYQIPDELQQKFMESPEFKTAFQSLTPGRQKGYLLYFSEAKQTATRTARIDKYVDRILMGKGMRDCACGHSKRMPNCDGSHKRFAEV